MLGKEAVHNLKSHLTPLALFTYTYDDAGNRVHVDELGGIRVSYSYDAAGQLTRERRNGANADDTTYD